MIVANGTGDDVKLELRRGVFPPSASGSLRIATVSDGAKWKSASLTITAELEPESSFAREGSVAAPLVAGSFCFPSSVRLDTEQISRCCR